MTLQKNQNSWEVPEIYLQSKWKPEAEKKVEAFVESRSVETSKFKKKSRLLVSSAFRYNRIEIAAGHRYLPGIYSFYLSNASNYSGLSGLPPGRQTGSAWAWIHFENFITGTYYLENSEGVGFSIAQNKFWQFNYHPGSKTGSFTFQHNSKNSQSLIDVQKTRTTTTGYSNYKINTMFEKNYFAIEAERKEGDDYYFEPIFYQSGFKNDFKTLPEDEGFQNECNQVAPQSNCKIIRKGKNGQFSLQGMYNGFVDIQFSGQDQPENALRMVNSLIHIPVDIVSGALLLGAAKTGFRNYTIDEQSSNEDNSLSLPDFYEQPESTQTQSDSYFEDNMAVTGYEFKTASLISGIKIWFPKYASRRLEIYMSASIQNWKFGWSALLMDGKKPHQYDFFWLRQANPARSSIRFYNEGRGALLLFVKSRHLYFYVSLQNKGDSLQSWTKLQWQSEF